MHQYNNLIQNVNVLFNSDSWQAVAISTQYFGSNDGMCRRRTLPPGDSFNYRMPLRATERRAFGQEVGEGQMGARGEKDTEHQAISATALVNKDFK